MLSPLAMGWPLPSGASDRGTVWGVPGTTPHLHKGEGRPGAEGLILVLQLVSHILFYALLRVDPLFLIHSEQGSGGHRDGDRILRLWLQEGGTVGQAVTQTHPQPGAPVQAPPGPWGVGKAEALLRQRQTPGWTLLETGSLFPWEGGGARPRGAGNIVGHLDIREN